MGASGLKFPLTISGIGRFDTVDGLSKYVQNARRIINTIKRERFYEPNMGSTGYKLLFRNFNEQNGGIIANIFQESLNEQEPRALWRVSYVEETLDGKVIFRIYYKAKNEEASDVFTEEFEI